MSHAPLLLQVAIAVFGLVLAGLAISVVWSASKGRFTTSGRFTSRAFVTDKKESPVTFWVMIALGAVLVLLMAAWFVWLLTQPFHTPST